MRRTCKRRKQGQRGRVAGVNRMHLKPFEVYKRTCPRLNNHRFYATKQLGPSHQNKRVNLPIERLQANPAAYKYSKTSPSLPIETPSATLKQHCTADPIHKYEVPSSRRRVIRLPGRLRRRSASADHQRRRHGDRPGPRRRHDNWPRLLRCRGARRP